MELLHPDASVLVDHLPWVRAFLDATTDCLLLKVRRSLMLPDDDELWLPIKELIRKHNGVLRTETRVQDPALMFGEGFRSCYRLKVEGSAV